MISSCNIVGAKTRDLHAYYLKVEHEITSRRNRERLGDFERVTRVALSMFARMSGPIRRLLGPTKARLQGYIKQARTLFMVPINESDLDKEETQLEDLIQQLSTNIALLERCNKEWTMLLTEMPKGEEIWRKSRSICGPLMAMMDLSNYCWIQIKWWGGCRGDWHKC